MSEYLGVLIRERGTVRYHEDKWRGDQVDRWLLEGPDAVLQDVRDFALAADPGWWCVGLVWLDIDQRRLTYWATQFLGERPGPERYYRALLDRRWPGWTTRWSTTPAVDLFRELGDEQILRDAASPDPLPEGLDEPGYVPVWISVRDAGTVRDYALDWAVDEHIAGLGPKLLKLLADQTPAPSDVRPDEWVTEQTLLVDVGAQRLHLWSFIPRYHEAVDWPSWELAFHDGGPRRHEQLLGRELPSTLSPREVRERVREVLPGHDDELWEVIGGGAPEPFPIGATAGGGRFTILDRIRGEPAAGMYDGMDRDGTPVLITIGPPQRAGAPPPAQAELPHVTPLLAVGPLDGNPEYHVLVERKPAGLPLTEEVDGDPLPLDDVLSVARTLVDAPLADLRPELVYVDPARTPLAVTALAPRATAFLRNAEQPDHGVPLMFDGVFLPPEMVRGEPCGPPGDVFNLCLLLAYMATGAHPFAGDTLVSQALAIVNGARRPWTADERLGRILDAGLAAEPARRPPLRLLAEQLRRL